MNPLSSPLLTDLYELTMLQAYLEHGMTGEAVFELFVRKLPPGRNFLLAAGLEQALDFVAGLRFGEEELDWIERSKLFRPSFVHELARLRFSGDIHAIAEGSVVFADEPLLRVTAPFPEAQLLETRVLNLVHFQTTIASKAARCRIAAPGKGLIDFGLRRAHGAEAGLLAARAFRMKGVRLDSGDLAALSRQVRRILDQAGMSHAIIFASGNLGEHRVAELVALGAPIDSFGVGTSLVTSADHPYLDAVYKLQEYAGRARRKRSTGKATWPGRKQVYRRRAADGALAGDVVTIEGDAQPGEPLLELVMRQGKRLPGPPLAAMRSHALEQLARLPAPLRSLEPAAPYPVEISPALRSLADEVDRAMRA